MEIESTNPDSGEIVHWLETVERANEVQGNNREVVHSNEPERLRYRVYQLRGYFVHLYSHSITSIQ